MAEDSLIDISANDISKLKVPDLKKELKNRGLSTTGNKNELVERLQASLKASSDVMDDIEEDLLNDDDDEHLDENESVIHEFDNELEDSPGNQKRKLTEITTDKSETNNEPPKKVILNRNNNAASVLADKQTRDVEKISLPEKPDGNTDEKKVIKLSELSVKERLEMRAKKFGVTALSDNAKKLVRAERFGNNSVSVLSDSPSIKLSDNTNLDVLKQRAARFGGSVSSVMSDLETQEKLEKRKERFGAGLGSNGTSDVEKAKAARLERFKQSVK
ncbi:SAP domain-containing ribonucleoprotein [Cylas formicarius]|uniref:SAP domain-containing ribonucleoprotein n=1 Tax=Cylas formicarius TaxID=197179 RepID=UPI002958C7CF|nr:SAP domain-containing ribonucleoprotein [Cylas formicarius]